MKKILMFFSEGSKNKTERVEKALRFTTEVLGAEIVKCSYDAMCEMIKNSPFVFRELVSDTAACLVFPTDPGCDMALINATFDRFVTNPDSAHFPLVPINCFSVSTLCVFPNAANPASEICTNSKLFADALLSELEDKSSIYKEMEIQVGSIEAVDMAGLLSECTPSQLFLYAVGILRGLDADQELGKAISILTNLVGNDAFMPSAVVIGSFYDLEPASEEILTFSDRLSEYIASAAYEIMKTENYQDAEKLLDYWHLLQDVSENYMSCLTINNARRAVKELLSRCFDKTDSPSAARWILDNDWQEAKRCAENSDTVKAASTLLSVMSVSDRAYEKFRDSQSLLYMYKAAHVLRYLKKKNVPIRENETVTTVSDDRILQSLGDCLSYAEFVYASEAALTDAAEMLVLCKMNTVGSEISEWYRDSQELILQSAESLMKNGDNTHLRAAINNCRCFIDLLESNRSNSSCEAIIEAALYMIELFDKNEDYFTSIGWDKRLPYGVLERAYEKSLDFVRTDEYAIKQYEIMLHSSGRSSARIHHMLRDIHARAVRRKEENVPKSYEMLIMFGWNICASVGFVNPALCDKFIADIRKINPNPPNPLPSEEKIEEYRKADPDDPEEATVVYGMACREIFELFRHFRREDYKSVPRNFICMIRSHMNLYYDFVYDTEKDFSEQKLLGFTRDLMDYIFYKFLRNDK